MIDMPEESWVARFVDCSEDRPQIGRVKDSYDGVIDIVLFSHTGEKIGRQSPAAGGPTSFEPACSAENWEPIEKPDFKFIGDKFFYGRHLRRLQKATDADGDKGEHPTSQASPDVSWDDAQWRAQTAAAGGIQR